MPMRVLLGYLARHRVRYAQALALLLITNVCALAVPWIVKNVFDALSRGGPAARAAVITGALSILGLAAMHGLARSGSRLVLLSTGQQVEAQIRDDLFARLLLLPPGYYQSQRAGDIMSRATNDLQSVATLVGFGLLSIANTAIVYVGTLVAMLRIDPWLTLAVLLPYPALVLLGTRFNSRIHAESLAVQQQLARLSTKAQENLAGAAVVRAYTIEDAETDAFRGMSAEFRERTLRLARTQGAFSGIMGIMGGLGALTILWLGGGRVMAGQITLGAFVAFGSYLAYLAWPTVALGWVLAMVRRGLTAMGRIVEVMTAPTAVVDHPDSTGPATISGEIELRHLTFSYDGYARHASSGRPDSPGKSGGSEGAGRPEGDGSDRGVSDGHRAPALRDVSLRIPAGTCVAIVGPTGAGKTTLASLLPRLWDPPPGTILIDGRDVRAIPLRELRIAIGVVPQEAFLFSRPLAENVALGAEADGRLEWAGRISGLTGDVARLPAGWDTVVGERGLSLSGGQRQRATLARALLRDPRILILDDAFASVDAEKEAEILGQLREALRGRTALIITHRLRAARVADRVVVLDAGRIVEQGSHADLLVRGGLYARLWRRQQLESRLETVP